MPFEELLDWASNENRPTWQRDALRRLAEHGELTEDDLSVLRKHIEVSQKLSEDELPELEPLAKDHLSEASSNAPKTVLASLGPVKHVDRLESDQSPIRFAVNGITRIYGPNGSGKSGYCRITKQMCRSLEPDKLRGNVYNDAPASPAEVGIGFRVGGDDQKKEERAKHLADEIASDPGRKGDKILFTTFTSTLARDVEANLGTLCPHHISGAEPVIDVVNLDRWVGDFLKRRGFDRSIVYFGEERDRLDDIWREVLANADLPEGLTDEFIKDEWAQVIQAKGVGSERDYFTANRAGCGTPLDRRKRRSLWSVFEAYRARMIDEGLAEPDDAYREAIAILEHDRTQMPYTSVVVDEAQDMGEPALRLVRAIVPKSVGDDRNSLFIVGDAHQRIYARKATMSACGIEVRGRARRLRLNYRTTEMIRRYAVAILEGVEVDDLDDSVDTLAGYRSLVQGVDPIRFGARTKSDELAALVDWVGKLRTGDPEPSSIAVLVRTNAQLGEVETALRRAEIPSFVLRNNTLDDPDKPGVRIATMHRAKGLEFDCVALALLNQDLIPPRRALDKAVDKAARREIIEREKSLVHVASTRARSRLRVSWHGSRPNLIQD